MKQKTLLDENNFTITEDVVGENQIDSKVSKSPTSLPEQAE